MDEVFRLFPTPFLRAPATLDERLVEGLVAHFTERATRDNTSSPNLSHTEMLQPSDSPLLSDVASLVTPKLIEFGVYLFGERMPWGLKEMWVNVLDQGGRQAMHNHANSFISGVAYLTRTHPEARTVFMRPLGGTDFSFKNDHAGVHTGPYNAEKWISMPPEPGDV